jgi:hypothetical protein
MKNLRIQITDDLHDRIEDHSTCFGSKSYLIRAGLEVYFTLRQKGVLNGTERLESIPGLIDQMLSH